MDSINIVEPDSTFDFKKLSIGSLTNVPGGSYFSRLYFENKPLYIQTPKSLTKQGFIKSGKRQYCDLMFTNNDELFVHWIENLETTCQQLLFEKNDEWFTPENRMELNDIESSFTSPLKLYKSGRFYLVRANIKPNIKIYNDTTLIQNDSITSDTCLVTVIEVQGIKFTAKNFQIEMEIKQCLVVSPDPFLDNCLIKKPLVKTALDKKEEDNRANTIATANVVKNLELLDDDDAEILELSKKFLSKPIISNQTKTEPKLNANTVAQSSLLDDLEIMDTNDAKFLPNDVKTLPNDVKNLPKDVKTLPKDAKKDIETITKINTELNGKTIMPIAGANKSISVSLNTDISNIELGEIEILDASTSDMGLTEVVLTPDNCLETITLKKPNEVYYEIYNEARKKAKDCKKAAILAYLEAKNIKKTYMLEEMDESDGSDESDFEDLEVDDLGEFEEE
jgi:hypothetical protein